MIGPARHTVFEAPDGEITVTARLRAAVESVRAELGLHGVVISPGWGPVAAELGLEPGAGTGPATFGVGLIPDTVDRAVGTGGAGAQGPTNQGETRHWVAVLAAGCADATISLWRRGWTPVTVHRVRVPLTPPTGSKLVGWLARRDRVELAVMVARPTPERPPSG